MHRRGRRRLGSAHQVNVRVNAARQDEQPVSRQLVLSLDDAADPGNPAIAHPDIGDLTPPGTDDRPPAYHQVTPQSRHAPHPDTYIFDPQRNVVLLVAGDQRLAFTEPGDEAA